MKRILIFSLAYFPKHVGGAEVAIKEITERIASDDIEFHMIALRFDSTLPKVEQIGNVLVHRIGFTKPNATMSDLRKFPLHLNKFLYQFYAPFVGLQLNRKYHYDGAWAMMAHSCGVPTTLFNLFSGVPYVQTLQEGDPIPYIMKKARPVYPLFVRAFRKASVIQTISTFLAGWAKDMGATCPIIVVPNAVDTKHFAQIYTTEELNELKQKIGKKEGEQYIITTSRLVPKNAVDIVIRALQFLPENVEFLVLGIGPDELMLKKLEKDLGVEGRVMFIGQVEHKELPKYLRIADVFTRPSRSEGMGNSFVEAMAADIPVVATNEGGITDFLFDPDKNPDKQPTGLFAITEDPNDTARQLARMLSDNELREKCIKNAKALVMREYDWSLIAQNMREKVFARLFSSL
jgi:glycosyltransferase involved in cell wall biosynthesis